MNFARARDRMVEEQLVNRGISDLRVLAAMSGGSMLSWAILREGRVTQWLRDDIEMLLGPLRKRPRKARNKPKRRA